MNNKLQDLMYSNKFLKEKNIFINNATILISQLNLEQKGV
jgi:hypothetical protein